MLVGAYLFLCGPVVGCIRFQFLMACQIYVHRRLTCAHHMYIGYLEKYACARSTANYRYTNMYLYDVCIRTGIRICNASLPVFKYVNT